VLDAGLAVVEIVVDVAPMRAGTIGQIESAGFGVDCDLAVGEEVKPWTVLYHGIMIIA
jgi:hypothetical protein